MQCSFSVEEPLAAGLDQGVHRPCDHRDHTADSPKEEVVRGSSNPPGDRGHEKGKAQGVVGLHSTRADRGEDKQAIEGHLHDTEEAYGLLVAADAPAEGSHWGLLETARSEDLDHTLGFDLN